MAKKMLIDATHPEETRVVVVDGNRVEEFDYETVTKAQISGNIYLAKVTRVEPSLQAAFVEYGGGRHGFLAFNEVHPDYYQIPVADREALLEAERQAAQREAEEEELAAESAEEDEDGDSKGRRGRKNGRGRGRGDRREKREPRESRGPREPGEGSSSARPRRNRRSLKPAGDLGEAALPDRLMERLAAGALPLATLALPEIDPAALAALDADTAMPDFSDVESIEILQTVEDETGASHIEKTTLAGGSVVTERVGAPGDAIISGDVIESDADAEWSNAVDDGDAQQSGDAQQTGAGAKDTTDEDTAAADESEQSDDHSEDGSEDRSTAPGARGVETDDDDLDADDDEDSDVEEVGAVDAREEIRPRKPRLRDYKIQEVIKRRQIMLVQVVKEERGNKGAALTTYLSLAGRYCVLMPNTARGGGISRKITNAADRKRLKAAATELDVPEGMGLIIRTAGANRTKAEIKRDYEYLLRQWSSIRELTLRSIAPTLIYEEGSLIKRAIRDLYSKDIDGIVVEGDEGFREARDYMKMLMPSHTRHVQAHREQTPLFIRYQVESQMSAMMQPVVQLKSGGYLVIGVTEALVAIDVNSGKSTKESSIEETALKTNLEAADEVARQMRLRDLAGLIVIDFIDMEESKNDRSVEKRLKDALKTDRARIQIGRISAFGLLEMSRQRLRPGLLEATTVTCPHCKGAGVIRSEESMALSVLRAIEEEALKGRTPALKALAPVPVANYVLNHKRARLNLIEERHDIQIFVEGDPMMISPDFRVEKTRTVAREEPVRTAAVQMDAGLVDDDFDDAEILDEEEVETDIAVDDEADAGDAVDSDSGDAESDEDAAAADRKRRGRRGGRRRKRGPSDESGDPLPVIDLETGDGDGDEGSDEPTEAAEDDPASGDDAERKSPRRRTRSRRGGKNRSKDSESDAVAPASAEETTEAAEPTAVERDDTPEAEPAVMEAKEPSQDRAEKPAPDGDVPSTPSAALATEHEDDWSRAQTSDQGLAPPRLVEVSISDDVADPDEAPKMPLSVAPTETPEASESPKRSESDKPRRTGWWAFRRGA